MGNNSAHTKSKGHQQIEKHLDGLGYEYESEFSLENKSYDIFIKDLNLLIEYNGTRWHYDPRQYDATDYDDVKHRFAFQKWYKDLKKVDLASENGFNIEVIWEFDWKNTRRVKRPRYLRKILSDYEQDE